VPRHLAGNVDGGRAHVGKRRSTASQARPHAGVPGGGTPMPASAQAARATCRLARRAATRRGSFLINFSAGGLF
jgi:hypothetical protein